MKEKEGEVFSIAKDNRPISGCTVSKEIYNGTEHITYFSLAAGTDISAEIYPYHKLILVADGSAEVYGADGFNRGLNDGDIILTPTDAPIGIRTSVGAVYIEISVQKEDIMNGAIKAGEVFNLAEIIPYQEGKIVNMDLVNNDKMKFVVMAFDKDTGLAEHAAPGEHALVGHRVLRQQRHLLQSAEARQRLPDRALGGRAGRGGAHPVDHHLDPAGGALALVELGDELEQAAHSDGVRRPHDDDDVGRAHQGRRQGVAPRFEGVVVDLVLQRPAGDVDHRPGGHLPAPGPHVRHGRGRQLPPAPGAPQAAEQAVVGADRDEQTDQALGVQARVRGEPGGRGQGGGVLGQAEDLDEAGGLDVGVDEDGPARPGQAVGQ